MKSKRTTKEALKNQALALLDDHDWFTPDTRNPNALRDARAVIRKAHDKRHGCPKVTRSNAVPKPEDVAALARSLYGRNAPIILGDQLRAIDPKDYDTDAVTSWRYALGLLLTTPNHIDR